VSLGALLEQSVDQFPRRAVHSIGTIGVLRNLVLFLRFYEAIEPLITKTPDDLTRTLTG
jgi:hypothetical protein